MLEHRPAHVGVLGGDARTQAAAQAFLNLAREAMEQAVAQVERAQMLVESSSRPALQTFLAAWQPLLQSTRSHSDCKGLIRWAVDVDPLAI